MMSDLKSQDSARRISDLIGRRERRKLRAERQRARDPHFHAILRGFATFGRVGWSIAVPTLIGAMAGAWIDSRHLDQHSWTLILLLAGLTIGCFNACQWLVAEHRNLTGNGGDSSNGRGNGSDGGSGDSGDSGKANGEANPNGAGNGTGSGTRNGAGNGGKRDADNDTTKSTSFASGNGAVRSTSCDSGNGMDSGAGSDSKNGPEKGTGNGMSNGTGRGGDR